jgi:hypothetical protein
MSDKSLKAKLEASDRHRRLDRIREYADVLEELSRRYNRLRWMAEQPERENAFLDLAEAVGKLSIDILRQTNVLLEIMFRASNNEKWDE